jgi:hypothetical protein
MTAPLGFRTVYPVPSATTHPIFPALPRSLPSPVNVADELAPAISVGRITLDHLALIRAMVEAGKFSRALELLDAVFQHGGDHEQCWYLRLWALTGAGKEAEALHLARSIVPRLPGSAALAYLQAALECVQEGPNVALESALRARAVAPGREEPEALVNALLGQSDETANPAKVRLAEGTLPPLIRPEGFSALAAALQGAALLHPAGSSRSRIPPLTPRIRQPDAAAARTRAPWRRFSLLALATVVAALWAIPDPVPAAIALAVVVVLVTRGMPQPARR